MYWGNREKREARGERREERGEREIERGRGPVRVARFIARNICIRPINIH